MAREAEPKEVTRGELEGYLWAVLNQSRSTPGIGKATAAQLLHESISAREAKEQKDPVGSP